MGSLPRGTVTLVFTDVQGSTDLLRELGRARYSDALNRHREILRDVFGARGGVEVELQGDSSFFSFSYAREAVLAAADVQRALSAHEWPHRPISIRVGIHTGEPEVTVDGIGYTGLDVHRAARVMSVAHGGQVLLTARTTDLVEGELPSGITVAPLGAYRLKDFERAEEIAQLEIEGLPTSFPPLRAERAQSTTGNHFGPRRKIGLVTATAFAVAIAAAVVLFTREQHRATTANIVVAIDPRRNAVVGRARVGNAPNAVAVGAGAVWVVNSGDGTLTKLSPQGRALRTIGTAGVPSVIAAAGSALWVGVQPNIVLKLDPQSGAFERQFVVRAQQSVFSPLVWLAVRGSTVLASIEDRLAIVDAKGGLTSTNTWPTPDWGPVAAQGDAVWEASNSVLYRLDRTGKRVLASLRIPEGPLAAGAGYLWMLNVQANLVAQIDPSTASVLRTYPVGDVPTGVAFGDGAVWVPSQDGKVTRIDPDTARVTATIDVGGTPQGVAVGFGRVWVAIS